MKETIPQRNPEPPDECGLLRNEIAMDAQTCLKKLQYTGVLSFATVDAQGNPQVRCISAIHFEPNALYFFTAQGKAFCQAVSYTHLDVYKRQ